VHSLCVCPYNNQQAVMLSLHVGELSGGKCPLIAIREGICPGKFFVQKYPPVCPGNFFRRNLSEEIGDAIVLVGRKYPRGKSGGEKSGFPRRITGKKLFTCIAVNICITIVNRQTDRHAHRQLLTAIS